MGPESKKKWGTKAKKIGPSGGWLFFLMVPNDKWPLISGSNRKTFFLITIITSLLCLVYFEIISYYSMIDDSISIHLIPPWIA